MCTCLIAGRGATSSGYAMLAANDDWDDTPGLITHVPRKKHAPDEVYALVGGHAIPEIEETWGYLYTACKYDIGNLDRAWAGGMNDQGVSVAGTGVMAFKAIPWKGMVMEPDDIPLLILRRAKTARGAVELIGELVARYGLRPSGLDSCQSGATFSIADPSEGWVLEITPGGKWVAVRVPDDEVSVRVNAFGTHDADLTDTSNVLASEGLAEYARKQGWWEGDEHHFDFAKAYGADKSPNEWGPELDAMNMRRRWRVMELISGKAQREDETRYSVKAAKAVTCQTLMDILSDVYDGTKYDLTKLPGGDPFADVTPDYALCRRGTVSSIVAEYTPDTGNVLWTAIATPRMSFYMPLYVDIDRLPDFCEEYLPGEGENASLFWEFKELCILTQRRFARHMEITGKAKRQWETNAAALLEDYSRKMEELEGYSWKIAELESHNRKTEELESYSQKITEFPENEARTLRTQFDRDILISAIETCRKTRHALLLQY